MNILCTIFGHRMRHDFDYEEYGIVSASCARWRCDYIVPEIIEWKSPPIPVESSIVSFDKDGFTINHRFRSGIVFFGKI